MKALKIIAVTTVTIKLTTHGFSMRALKFEICTTHSVVR
jgi:hypothetical protein